MGQSHLAEGVHKTGFLIVSSGARAGSTSGPASVLPLSAVVQGGPERGVRVSM